MLIELSLSLSPVPGASGVARSGVRDRFAGALGKNTMADLELVVSELVINAFDHGRGTIKLQLTHDDDELQGFVSDDGEGFAYKKRRVGDDEFRGAWALHRRGTGHALGHRRGQHPRVVPHEPDRRLIMLP